MSAIRFAIFPGSFNPVHLGHLMIAQTALEQFSLDKVLFVLSPLPPHKQAVGHMLSVAQREELVRSSLARNAAFEYDDREVRRGGVSFTIQTVREVKRQFALAEDDKLGMILGLDSFLSLESWQESGALAQHCLFLVAPRSGWELSEIYDSLSGFHEKLDWELLNSPSLPISSSQIRKRKAGGDAYRYLLSEDTFELYSRF